MKTLIGIFAALALVVSAIGYLSYLDIVKNARNQKSAELSSIATEKTTAIKNWRDRLRGQLLDLSFTPGLAELSRAARANAFGRAEQDTWTAWLDKKNETMESDVVYVVDERGNVIASSSSRRIPITKPQLDALAAAREFDRDILSDPYRAADGAVLVTAAAPIRTGVKGFYVLINANLKRTLFPLLASWPASSTTGEALLVTSSGDSAVVISDMRYSTAPPLTFTAPLKSSDIAAARAAAGLEGVTTVHDYRGAAVLAATRKVPGSTWAVAAKIDEVEIYGSTLFRVCIIVVAVFAALLVAAGCAAYAWHRDQGEHYRELYEAEMARKELELHYEHLTRHANDCILLLDAHQRIIEANERAQDTYGYTSEAFRTLNASDLRAETARSNFEQQFQRAVRKGGGIYETLHRRNDGSVFPAEVSVRAIRTASGLFYQAIIRDTTEKKKHEAMIARVNRLNGLLAKVAQAMLRVDDASEFYSTLCRLAVEQGGFKAASVSLVFGDQVARPTACYGIPAEAVRACDAALGDDAPETLMRAALIDGTIQVSNDLIADLRTAPMRVLAQAESYVAAAVCPFRSKNDVVGAIALFSSERDSFGEPERHVLATLTADISYAVDALASARERDQALLALRANSALLRKISDNVPAMVWISDAAGKCTYANRRGFEFAGTSNIQELAEWWMQAVHPEDQQRCFDAYEEAMRSRREMDVEYRLRHADGNYHWVQNRGVPHFLEDGTFSGFVGACTDITGRKEQEFALRRTEALWRSALECADAGVWTRDLSTNTVTVCERFKQLFGFQPGDDAPLVAIAGRVHPSDRARVLTRVTDNSEAYEDHYRVIWPDGSEHWMCSRGRVEQDEQGTPIRLVAVVTDVTARMHESELEFTHASIAELARALDGAASQTAVA